jgi:hypothetical protein
MKQHMFVNIMMTLQLGAIISYGFNQKWALVLYWFACLLINFVVTYMLGK